MPLANGHVTGPAYEQVQSVGNSAPNGAGQRSRASSVSSVDTWNTDPSEPDQEGLPAALRPGPKIPANSTSIPDYNLPNNERHILVLHYSRNCLDWVPGGIVARGNSPRESRHYASMVIDGEDLHVLSRSGAHRAKTAHAGNLITFHTVRDFRRLVVI